MGRNVEYVIRVLLKKLLSPPSPVTASEVSKNVLKIPEKKIFTFPACHRLLPIPGGPSYDFPQAENPEEQGDLRSKVTLAFSKESDQWPRHYSSDESHDHEHGEDALRKYAHVITDIKRDELHQSSRVHQCAELKRLAPFHAGKTSSQSASTELSGSGYRDNKKAD